VSAADPGALARARAQLVQAALEEDIGDGDWTTEWTVEAGSRSRAVIVAKQAMVAAGTLCVPEVFRAVDPGLAVDLLVEDGARVADGDVVVRLSGSTRAILTGERTALNFLGRLSGIATLTRAFVDAVAGTGAQIIDTRKTTPGWRLLEKAAVRAGGGGNHRVGLYDMVLVKDNHADARGGVVAATRAALRQNSRGLPVEVEVRTLEELDEVLRLGVERILLDNMSLDSMREAVRRTLALGEGRPQLEASGNITLRNVRSVAETGVDLISVGALTHSAPTADVSLRMAR
jgi:nicotinate-nucleotide pyrophosphorylase (carboxylating)